MQYIAHAHGIIYGYGDSPESALENSKKWSEQEDNDGNPLKPNFETTRATAGLVLAVDRWGGDIGNDWAIAGVGVGARAMLLEEIPR